MSKSSLEMKVVVPLDKFDLKLQFETRHRVIGLFGHSGSGKTTIIETLAGLRKQARGRIACGGEVWMDTEARVKLPPEKRGIGYVPQEHLLFPHMNVRRNLEAGAGRLRMSVSERRAIFEDVVRTLDLEKLLNRSVAELSGGERQRVSLGRALYSQPRLLLLDEPLASLDIELRHRILPFLLRVRDHFEVPMLIVSHNPMELLALCDEVIALREGRMVAQGHPTEVFTRKDVYATASREGFENVLPAVVMDSGEHSLLLGLGEDGRGREIRALKQDIEVGQKIMVGIPAQDILVASHKMKGVSARNQVPACIQYMDTIGHRVILRARIEETLAPDLVVELTRDAVEELVLQQGGRLWLLIKSSSVSLYG